MNDYRVHCFPGFSFPPPHEIIFYEHHVTIGRARLLFFPPLLPNPHPSSPHLVTKEEQAPHWVLISHSSERLERSMTTWMPTPFNYPLFRSRCLLIREGGKGCREELISAPPLPEVSLAAFSVPLLSASLSLSLLFLLLFYFFPRFFLVFGEEVPSRSFFFLFVLMSCAVFHFFFLHFSIFFFLV